MTDTTILRPVREHDCKENGQGYCSICVAHALNPQNVVTDGRPMPAIQFFAALVMISVIVWAIGCADWVFGPQKPTTLEEIHNEYKSNPPEQNWLWGATSPKKPVPSPVPLSSPTVEPPDDDDSNGQDDESLPAARPSFHLRKLEVGKSGQITSEALKLLANELASNRHRQSASEKSSRVQDGQ